MLYAGAHALGGWVGVVILAAASITLAFGLLARFLSERLPTAPAIILTIAAVLLTSQHLLARPHVLTLPILVLWVSALITAVEKHRAPTLALLPAMTLWANLHGGFTFGLFMIAPFALEALIAGPRSPRRVLAMGPVRRAGFARGLHHSLRTRNRFWSLSVVSA